MSGSGSGVNVYVHGGKNGQPQAISEGGNTHVKQGIDKVKNIGRLILRTAVATRLTDLPASWVMITNKEGNGTVWIGGYDVDAPAVGVGIPLIEGNSITLPCLNLNQWSLIASNDGDEVYVIAAVDGNDTTASTPSNPPPLDIIPPTITGHTPAAGAVDIERNASITITVSEALDAVTIDSTTVTLTVTTGGAVVPATTSIDSADPTKITIMPSTMLAATTSYTVTVTTSVKDVAGNALAVAYSFAFTTKATLPGADVTPPTVVSHSPTQNETSVPKSRTLTVTFSEAMLLSSFTTTTVKIIKTATGDTLPSLTYSLSTDLKKLTIAGYTLEHSTAYRIDILGGSSGVADIAGNKLVTTYSISFSTSTGGLVTKYTVSGDTYDDLYSGGITESSIKIATTSSVLFNEKGKVYKPVIKKVGSPPGNWELLWQRKTAGASETAASSWTTYKTLYSGLASGLGTSDTTVTINDDTNVESFKEDDRITVRYTGGSSSNCIKVRVAGSDAVDGVNTHRCRVTGTTVTNVTDTDVAMTIQCE